MANFNVDSIVNKVLSLDDLDDDDSFRQILVSVAVDESISPELIAYARRVLRPKGDQARINVVPYFEDAVQVSEDSDLLIVLANASDWTGAVMSFAKADNVPAVVLTENVDAVVSKANATGFKIDYENIISTQSLSLEKVPGGNIIDKFTGAGVNVIQAVVDTVGKNIPRMITGKELLQGDFDIELPKLGSQQAGCEELFNELGKWVMTNCPTISNSFAAAFDFAKPAKVDSIARRTAFENGVTGAVFFIPGADFPVMTTNQVKMLVQIERSFGIGIDKQTIPEVVGILVLALVSRTTARSLCKSFPIMSWFIKTGIGYLVTLGLGRGIIAYCREGRVLPVDGVGKFSFSAEKKPVGESVSVKIDA
ncbi:MAG: hypothetical protein ACOYIK_03420 [Coriobacteriales bacterium]|jgi:uncharacterized protein (DUF697 family)